MLTTRLMLALMIAVAARILWVLGRRRIAGWLIVAAGATVYSASLMPVGDALLGPLEREYLPLETANPLPKGSCVVVLGSGYAPRGSVSVVGALDREGLVRVVEGVRIARRLGTVRPVVSGGAPEGRVPSALGYAALARDLGVDAASLIMLDRPLNTRDEAYSVAAVTQGALFLPGYV